MKVMLLNPPVKGLRFTRDGRCQSEEHTWLDAFPPATFASIVGSVRTKHDTKALDCIGSRISFEDCIGGVRKYMPQFVIMNTSTPTIETDLEIAKQIKEETDAKVIMYGEHVTARYDHLLKNYKQLDFAILGEPETPIMNILAGNERVAGVATRDWCGGTWQEPNLDDLPFPAYDILPPYNFPLTGERWMFVRSGRGCPYNCIYCIVPMMSKNKLRYHSPEYMVRQFKWLANELGIKVWMLWDELATFDKERMKKLCNLIIEEDLNKDCKWFCTTRVDWFDEELAPLMKKAGCRMMAFGFESGSQDVLNKNKKAATIEQAKRAVRITRKYGIKSIGHFIIGLPGDTEESIRQTINFAKGSGITFVQFYIATPFPGSEFYKMATENKWVENGSWGLVEQGSAVVSYPNLSSQRIQELRRQAYKEFYFRPQFFVSAVSMTNPLYLLKRFDTVLGFSKWMKR